MKTKLMTCQKCGAEHRVQESIEHLNTCPDCFDYMKVVSEVKSQISKEKIIKAIQAMKRKNK